MKNNKWIKPVVISIVLAVMAGMLIWAGVSAGGQSGALAGTFWSLFPPVVAICLALITKEVYSSLFVGILVGGLLSTGFNPVHTVDSMVTDGFISAVSGSAGIFIFLVLLGVIVALLNKAGGSQAFGAWAAKHVKTKIGSAIATF